MNHQAAGMTYHLAQLPSLAAIDQHVTPRAEALAVIHTNAETIAKHYGDQWPHHGGCMDAADSGCPLCRILAASEGTPE